MNIISTIIYKIVSAHRYLYNIPVNVPSDTMFPVYNDLFLDITQIGCNNYYTN
jgi:hypothetical protein